MLGVKQDNINSNFLSFWYDSTWDWTTVSENMIGKDKITNEKYKPTLA